MLESVRLTGERLCGDRAATATGAAPAFECPQLPSPLPSAWLLTPPWETTDAAPPRMRANRTAVINASGPEATEIDVELVRGDGQLNLPLEPVTPATAGSPGEVAASGQVGVTAFDQGGRRMWMVEVLVSTCADSRHLQIFNRSTRSTERSVPLDVFLVRDPAGRLCIASSETNGGPGTGLGDPVNLRPQGGCAGGGTGKEFRACETCPSLGPRGLSVYFAGRYCTWEEVLEVHGYAGKGTVRPQLCRLSQVGSREACEGR